MWALQPGYESSEDERVVLGGPAVGGLIDSAERLRDRLDTKAVKYDLREKPFAIVVGARDSWCDIGEIHEALTGTPAVVVATGASTRCGNGFYGLSNDRPEGKNPQPRSFMILNVLAFDRWWSLCWVGFRVSGMVVAGCALVSPVGGWGLSSCRVWVSGLGG